MSVVLVGSNPGLLLYSGERPVAAGGVWVVDWSVWGSGTVLMAVDHRGWRTVGTDEHLARILLERFNRHFPDFQAFAAQTAFTHTTAEVELDCDLRSGLRAAGGGIELQIAGVKDHRQFSEPAFPLGDIELGLSNVYVPCSDGELVIDDEPVQGRPRCELRAGRWSSTGYLAVAEVWTDPTDALNRPDASAGVPMAAQRSASSRRARHLHAIGSN